MTWLDRAERLKGTIIGALLIDHRTRQPLMLEELATRIQERLLGEIPAEGFLKMSEVSFAYVDRYEKELKPGNPILIR